MAVTTKKPNLPWVEVSWWRSF